MKKKQLTSILCAAVICAASGGYVPAQDTAEDPILSEDAFASDLEDEFATEAAGQDKGGKSGKNKDKKKDTGKDLDEVKGLIEDDDEIKSNSIPGEPEMSLEEMWDDQMHNRQFPGFEVDPSRYPAANITENTITLYRFLTEELGLSHAAACGVLANVQLESNFRPLALGDSGTSYGICQWHNSRFTNLMNFCKARELDYNTLEGQMAYLAYELHHGYRSVYELLLGAEDDAEGAFRAAYDFCAHFEMPDQTEARSIRRGNLARTEYYDKDFDQLAWELVHAQLIDGSDWLGLMERQLAIAAQANVLYAADEDEAADQSAEAGEEASVLPEWQSALGEPRQLL